VPARASLTPSGEFRSNGWSSGPVAVAVTFKDRWRGLRPSPADFGLLLKTRSVHSFGMKRDLLLIGLDARGTVIDTRTLRPGRIVTLPTVVFILELNGDRSPPRTGSVLTWHGAGSTDPLRHSDRQPR
jgi:uncharacterized membrane protein (UPF0127 family)